MSEKTYYDWLYSIDGSANPRHCVVMSHLPFMEGRNAVSFLRRYFPEVEMVDRPVVADAEKASEIAAHSQYEVQYIIAALRDISKELIFKAETYKKVCEDYEKRDKSLFDDVQNQLNHQYVQEYCNMARGVLRALEFLHKRALELSDLAGQGKRSDWRYPI